MSDQEKDLPEQAAPAEPPKPAVSEQKKNALLRYMAVLFGVAFLLVALSFLIQVRDSRQTVSQLSQSNASALQNAEKLQEANRALTTSVADWTEKFAAQEQTLTETETALRAADNALETAEKSLAETTTRLADTQTAYDLLLVAQAAQGNGEADGLKKALTELTPLKDCLSAAAQAQYTQLLTAPATQP